MLPLGIGLDDFGSFVSERKRWLVSVLFSLRVSFFGRLPSLVTGCGVGPRCFPLSICDSNVVLHLWGVLLCFAIAGSFPRDFPFCPLSDST